MKNKDSFVKYFTRENKELKINAFYGDVTSLFYFLRYGIKKYEEKYGYPEYGNRTPETHGVKKSANKIGKQLYLQMGLLDEWEEFD